MVKEARYLALCLAVFVGVWIILPRLLDLADSRWMRDLRHVTPFRDVVVLQTKATEYTLTVSGYLIKDRDCEAIGPPDVLINDGEEPMGQGSFDGSLQPKGTPESLSASSMTRRFRLWVFVSETPWPKSATMLRTHLCPDSANLQTNRVLTVPWVTSNERQPQ